MKKLYLLIFLILTTTYLFAQVAQEQEPKGKLWDDWYININGGQTLFLGDVSKHFEWYKPSFSESSSAFGTILSKKLSCVFDLRAQFFTGKLYGRKDFFVGGAKADLEFKSNFWNLNINTILDFNAWLGKCNPERKFSLYGIIGIGITDFKSQLFNSITHNEITSTAQLHSFTGDYAWTTELVVPVGLGASYKIGNKIKINLESILNMTMTDKIDRVKGMSGHDGYYYTSLGITYKLSKWNRSCDCKKVPITNRVDTIIINNNRVDTIVINNNRVDTVIINNNKVDTVRINNNRVDTLIIKEKSNIIDSVLLKQEKMAREIDSLKNLIETSTNQPNDTVGEFINEIIFNSLVERVITDVKDTIQGSGYLFKSVYFDVNKWNINPEERPKVKEVAEALHNNPTLKIKIIGNTDQQGSFNYNIWLSKQRAESVAKNLTTEYKINPNRYTLDWKGYTEPLSEKYYYINRRVDFLKMNP